MRRAILGLVWAGLAAGCVAPLPAPARGADVTGCHPGAYGPLSEHRCRRDSDCVLCGAADRCGALTTRERLALTNAACPRPDPQICQGRAPRCCAGRCVLSLGPPPL